MVPQGWKRILVNLGPIVLSTTVKVNLVYLLDGAVDCSGGRRGSRAQRLRNLG